MNPRSPGSARQPAGGTSRGGHSIDATGIPCFPLGRVKQTIVTLDMEGVLTPEIWIAVAEKTGIPGLRRTTRDEPDYDKLMRYRLEILDRHGIRLSDIQGVIGGLSLLDGARTFLDELRTRTQVIILSDTFEQFAMPLIKQMNWPTLFCHRLVVEADRITGYQLRMADQKRQSVRALQLLHFKVIAAGDSYNDTSMLLQADSGFLFHAPDNVRREFPQLPAFDSYKELLAAILGHAAEVSAIDTADVPPTAHPLPLVNVLRSDEPRGGADRDEVLGAAPAAEEGRFRVPRILGEAP